MSRATLKYVGVALIVCGVVLSTTGIGAFSTVTADRRMFVGVGGKSTSYLGISVSGATVATNGTTDTQKVGRETTHLRRTQEKSSSVVLGTVTNYFPAELDSIEVTVSKTSGPLSVSTPHVKNLPLKPGGQRNLLATVNCGGASRGTVTLTFEARGTDTHATAERTIPVTCVNESLSSAPSSPRRLSSPRRASIGSA